MYAGQVARIRFPIGGLEPGGSDVKVGVRICPQAPRIQLLKASRAQNQGYLEILLGAFLFGGLTHHHGPT